MQVTFYGTRGSIPVPEAECFRVGGNTPCVLVTFDSGGMAILDAGTGIRQLGDDLLKRPPGPSDDIFIVLSHTHWDHIQGFPFFRPAYDPNRRFTIAICGIGRDGESLKALLGMQMQREFFPTTLEAMGAAMHFWGPDEVPHILPSGAKMVTAKLTHPGNSYGYRFEHNGKILVYCSDVEHRDGLDPAVVALACRADLLIHDAQYTREEIKDQQGWGHSSWEQAVAVAQEAGVKKLALFHHDPRHTDRFLFEVEKQCQDRFPEAFLAREGMMIHL